MISMFMFLFACGDKSEETGTTTVEPSAEASSETGTTDTTAADAFCESYVATCGDWTAATACVDWYSAADAGTAGDSSGATQACYDYHLNVATTDADADPANGVYSMHCEHAAGAAPCQ